MLINGKLGVIWKTFCIFNVKDSKEPRILNLYFIFLFFRGPSKLCCLFKTCYAEMDELPESSFYAIWQNRSFMVNGPLRRKASNRANVPSESAPSVGVILPPHFSNFMFLKDNHLVLGENLFIRNEMRRALC